MNRIPDAIGFLNNCVGLFEWVKSAISSLKSQQNGTEKKEIEGDILRLQSDLQCLRDTLPAMYQIIDRAEWRIHDHSVADLLSKLKNAVYDAEDILEEFRWHELKVSVEGNATSMEPVINFFGSAIHGSFNTVTDIQKKLNHLSRQLEKMGLHQAIPRFDKSLRPETTSFPTEAKIFGRDKELKKLITLLGVPSRNKRKRSRVDNNEATIPNVPVLPIVGIGGVGKTTLAQNICNNPQVKSHFDVIIWTCVSDDFDVKRLTKEVIEQSSRRAPTSDNLNVLQGTLANSVSKRRRLTKEVIEQSSRRAPTSDNLNVLQGTLANSVSKRRFLIVLDDMWDENGQCWKMFCAPFKNVLQGSMILVTTRSQKVADIVGTTDPFPLEGLKDDVFWKFFKLCVFGSDSSNNDPELERIGKEILPKLRGSPLAAKTLGRLLGMSRDTADWNNILKSELWEHDQEGTEILPALLLSYMYLPFHLKRCFSFCAVYPKDHNFEKTDLAEIWVAEGFVVPQGNIPLKDIGSQYFLDLVSRSFFQELRGKYVIHDLIHDMAQLVSKDQCFVIKDTSDFQRVPNNVRHLSVLKSRDVKCTDLSKLCKHTKLRTLLCNMSLKSKDGSPVMEKWCTKLLCMRVIFCASISNGGLPENISNMKHLRYIKIHGSCRYSRLPTGLCCLYNLQLFYARKWEIDIIPSGFGRLINLQRFETLRYQFRPENEQKKKQFTFTFYPNEFLPSGFHPQNLPILKSLLFYYCCKLESISFSRNSQADTDSTGSSTFSSLIDIEVRGCRNLSSLEQCLQPDYIPAIKKIEIVDCNNVQLVPTERFGALHFLEELIMRNCPNIKSHRLIVPSLKKLVLNNSGYLGEIIECKCLTSLELSDYHLKAIELEKWSLPVLQELKIEDCRDLRSIKESGHISTDLSLGWARARRSTGKFRLLTRLTISACSKLESLDDLLTHECLPAIESIKISSCQSLHLSAEIFAVFCVLKNLEISGCPCLWQSGILLPPSLQKLHLCNCGDLSACFPRCLQNLSSLESLDMEKCQGIVSIPGDFWSSKLKSLGELRIQFIPDLVSIGGLEAIANISEVLIRSCPKLKEIKQPIRRGYP